MAFTAAFGPNFTHSKTLSATSTSSQVTLDSPDVAMSVIRICNKGPGEIFLRWGVAATIGAAVTTDMAMLAGAIEVFSKAIDVDTIAVICAGSDTATVRITCGEGL